MQIQSNISSIKKKYSVKFLLSESNEVLAAENTFSKSKVQVGLSKDWLT